MKTVRFSQVVAASGKPEAYTLWVDPSEDPHFQAAVKKGRVMTVHQEAAGSRSDYGEVGFTGDRHASFLLFPKSLAPFAEKRVVGVKYDLIAGPPLVEMPLEPEGGSQAAVPAEHGSPPAVHVPAEGVLPTAPPSKKPRTPLKPKLAAARPQASVQAEADPPVTPAASPAPPRASGKKAPKAARSVPAAPRSTAPGVDDLLRAVRRAMKELERGNSVAAYKILQELLPGA